MSAEELIEITDHKVKPLDRLEVFPIGFSEEEIFSAQETLRLNTIQVISLIEQYLQSTISEETRRILEEILQTYQGT